MKFLELLKTKENECVGLGEFLLFLQDAPLEELYVKVAPGDSIRILTIHKSKGLQFPVVIIPFLRMDITPETGPAGTKSHLEDETDLNLSLVRITKDYLPYSPKLRKIFARDYQKACIDEINSMYVALTRAQHELYIFIPAKSGSGKNKVPFFFPEDLKESGSLCKYAMRKRGASQPVIDISPSIYRDWAESCKSEFSKVAEINSRQSILEGNIMHFMLSRVDNCSGKDLDELIQRAALYAHIQYPFCQDLDAYQERLKQLITRDSLKDIFYLESARVYCEKEIVNKFGDLKRIDRIIFENKEIRIIDYKSSRENKEEHRRQVCEYVSIIKDIYPDFDIRGFIVYLDEAELEEVKYENS